ncbi:MAG: hypothetical protein O6941_06675 [Planctomycetota bacterium]|nr:hypothetical protein [Planctomycetota bacterium]MCZ6612302.1 hypothetical protein [Planctomycetota bacterium]MCZ6734308.1 hypothetical protein [Planctomycetota bacterium]MCZ6810410.1 hypothetical protein [Planctomycetota bacterium]MCZ6851272.1 hypothetical protein [Planctomycetota bacterium]
MVELKAISKQAIPSALDKAQRYRLLNDPQNAESICRDVLRADSNNQEALVLLLLTLTDQFGKDLRVAVHHAQEVLPRIEDKYERTYHGAVICERWAKAQLARGAPGYAVYEWFCRALDAYEQAQAGSPPGNDDAILRWNACARIMKRNEQIRSKPQDQSIEAGFEDEVPYR